MDYSLSQSDLSGGGCFCRTARIKMKIMIKRADAPRSPGHVLNRVLNLNQVSQMNRLGGQSFLRNRNFVQRAEFDRCAVCEGIQLYEDILVPLSVFAGSPGQGSGR